MSAEKTKYPIAIFELIQKGSGSGFIRDDTKNSANPVEIIHPKNRALINRSIIREKKDDAYINVRTRYIYGSDIIYEADQKKMGIEPNPKRDRVEFKNGLLTVPKDGGTVGLYKWMMSHAQNASNEARPEHLEAIFREIKPAEDAKQVNLNEFEVAEAVLYIKALVTQQGKIYVFQEERINALCNQFGIYAESPDAQVQSLIFFAKQQPGYFLKEAKKSEQVVLIQVHHALKLKVIQFADNTAMYVKKNEKIKSFPGNLSEEKKASALATYFQTVDGKAAYELFAAELAAAKSDSLQNN